MREGNKKVKMLWNDGKIVMKDGDDEKLVKCVYERAENESNMTLNVKSILTSANVKLDEDDSNENK